MAFKTAVVILVVDQTIRANMTTKLLLVASIVCFTVISGKDRQKREVIGTLAGGGMHISDMMAKSIQIALKDWAIRTELEKQMYLSGYDKVSKGSYLWHRSMFMNLKEYSKVQVLNQKGFINLRALAEFEKLSGVPIHVMQNDYKLVEEWQKHIAPYCECPIPKCNPKYPYRTADGGCNNFHVPTWGQAMRAQLRWLPAAYSDGLNVPRIHSITGASLPSPRLISNVVHNAHMSDFREPKQSMLMMQFGQFLDHDFVGTPTNRGFNNSEIQCCDLDPTTRDKRGSCFPIPVPPKDKRFHNPCMNFVRSSIAPELYCKPAPRNQINQQSSFIDGSMIYGNSMKEQTYLRLGKGGLLKMTDGGFLPRYEDGDCIMESPGEYCFGAGDDRNTIVPSLAFLHIVFLREHNRLAVALGKINPHWTDEIIFQETRKIIGGVLQHIMYSEWLPLVLNDEFMTIYGLKSVYGKYNTVYNEKLDPTTANVMAAAAFRFGHSMIPNFLGYGGPGGKKIAEFPIYKTYNRPGVLMSHGGKGNDWIGEWMLDDSHAKSDRVVNDGVRNYLFMDHHGMSFDLVSFNIQRGRDHGLPPYNAWRKWCGLPPVIHFGHGPGGLVDHDKDAIIRLSKTYKHVDDIDLYTGGLSERRVKGGLTGPTFQCLIGKSFANWKFGDRFWYENDFKLTGFSPRQLETIRHHKISKIICQNTKIDHIQPASFLLPSKHNQKIPCHAIPDIDLLAWAEPSELRTNIFFPVPANPVPIWANLGPVHFKEAYKHVAAY